MGGQTSPRATAPTVSYHAVLCIALIVSTVVVLGPFGYAAYKLQEHENRFLEKDREIAILQHKETENRARIAELQQIVTTEVPVETINKNLKVLLDNVREKRDNTWDGTETISLTLAQILELVRGPPGSPGKDGHDGRDGKDGSNGKDASGGAVFVRWGRKSCPSNSSSIYSGFAAGAYTGYSGSGVNYQCMPTDPEYNRYLGRDTGTSIRGLEYHTGTYGLFPSNAHNQNVPCTRCLAPQRTSLMMIPAKRNCPSSWTKEYEGYLMTADSKENRGYFICVDGDPEYVTGLGGDTGDEARIVFTQGVCSSQGHCPPYIDMAELTCVVCTK